MASSKVCWSIAAIAVPALIAGGFALQQRPGSVQGTDADTIPLALSAQRSCARVPDAEKQDCYERIFIDLVNSRGVRVAMGTLNRLTTLDQTVRDEGHVYAHAIGITVGRANRDVSQQFALCTEILQSGCYHGVIQGYFEAVQAVDTTSVNNLCAPWMPAGTSQWLRFQCAHGLGHGLTMIYAHDLPRGLQGCDLLREGWDRESCYGGAFMENIIHATAPHHPGTRLAAARDSAKADHSHHGSAPPAVWKALDSTDMHYPCSVLAQRYLSQCYMMQTSIMMRYTAGNVERTAAACLAAPGNLKYVCAQSLGRDITSYARENHETARRMCSEVSDVYEPWCHVGVAKNLIDLTAKPGDGIAYCRGVSGDPNRLKCYEAVGEQIATIHNMADARRAACDAIPEPDRAACYFGAQLPTRRPPALPSIRGD